MSGVFAVRVAVYRTEVVNENCKRELVGHIREPLTLACSQAMNDTPSLQMTVRWGSKEHDLLMQPCELALEYNSGDGTGWHEPIGGRFVSLAWSYNFVAGETVSITAPGLSWLLNMWLVLEGTGGSSTMDGMTRNWKNGVTAGNLMDIALNEASARGNKPRSLFVNTFTQDTDSRGAYWPTRTFSWKVGSSIMAVLSDMAADGFCDWWTQGYELNMAVPMRESSFNPTSVAHLRAGRDITAAHVSSDWSGMVHQTRVYGSTNKQLVTYAHDASDIITGAPPEPWGKFERFMHESSTSTIVGRSVTSWTLPLYQGERPRLDLTYELNLGSGGPTPHADYKPGDWVTAPHPDGTDQLMRVRQVTFQLEAGGALKGNLVLADRHHEILRIRELRVAHLEGRYGL